MRLVMRLVSRRELARPRPLPSVLVALLSLALCGAAFAGNPRRSPAPPPPPRLVVVDQGRVEAGLDRMVEQLARVEVLVEEVLRRGEAHRIERELQTLRERIAALRTEIRDAPRMGAAVVPPPVVAPPPPLEPRPTPPMSARDFERALSSLHHHGFSDERLEAVRQLAAGHWFLVDQVKRVLGAFSFGENKLKALRLLAPRIVDGQHRHLLLEDFTFGSDKEEAGRILDTVPLP